MNYEGLRKWLVRSVVGMAFLGLMTGCAPTMKYGSSPRTDRLETLRPGVSSTADVLLALGEPRGYGVARFPHDPQPLKIWSYEYTKAGDGRIDLKILLVFFSQERYGGHLWFSSAELLDVVE
jgi:hypothetical protein